MWSLSRRRPRKALRRPLPGSPSSRAEETRRLDEIRRDWLGQARQMQSDVVRLSLLLIGGSMIAVMTLIGVVIQARLPVDLAPLHAPLGFLGAALFYLLVGAFVQTAAVGIVAVFALDPESSLARAARWHGTVYWFGWFAWVVMILFVAMAFHKAYEAAPALFDEIQRALHQINAAAPKP